MEIKREEPPVAPARDGKHWPSIIEQLKAAPNEWFLVGEDMATSTSTYIRRRYGVESRLSGVSSETSRAEKVYARWVGDGAQVESLEATAKSLSVDGQA